MVANQRAQINEMLVFYLFSPSQIMGNESERAYNSSFWREIILIFSLSFSPLAVEQLSPFHSTSVEFIKLIYSPLLLVLVLLLLFVCFHFASRSAVGWYYDNRIKWVSNWLKQILMMLTPKIRIIDFESNWKNISLRNKRFYSGRCCCLTL